MSRVLPVVLLVGLSVAATGAAPAPTRIAPADSQTRTLLKLEDDWAAALVRRDEGAFRRMLAEGFVYTENDRTMDRETMVQELVSGADTVEAARNEEMVVHGFGTTAAVTGWLVVRGRGSGGPFDRRYRFTDTWVRRGAIWRIVAAQDYLVPAGKGTR